MRFKLDVSDRETGEIGTMEVESPNAQAARQFVRDAGYRVWATAPIPSSGEPQPPPRGGDRVANGSRKPLLEQAREGTFRAHPARFLASPLLRFLGGVLIYLSFMFAVLGGKGFPVPMFGAWAPEQIFWTACLLWIAGWWLGRPVARGRAAQRALADAEIVCRHCRSRGHVRTQQRGLLRKRLWGHCTHCGIRWTL